MHLDHLETFITVARGGSFSAAAERLHLTQPAVSKRIAALEQAFGARLFDRLGRRTTLTEAGRLLLTRADEIVAAVDAARRGIADLTGAVRGPVGIATSHHIGLHRLSPVLRAFRADYPEARPELHFLESEEACEQVALGNLELAVVTLPLTPGPRLEVLPLWHDTLHVVRATGESGPVETLLQGPAILPDRETVTRQIIEQGFADLGLSLRVELATNALETIKMLVSIGMGWSVLPHTLLDETLQVVEVPGLALTRRLGVVREQGRSLSAAGRALLTTLVACAEPASRG